MGATGDRAAESSTSARQAVGSGCQASPLYKPFESFPEAIGPADRSRLEARALEAIKGSIVPALERLHQFIATTYLPACRKDIAATQLSGRSGLLRGADQVLYDNGPFGDVPFTRSGSRK